MAIPTAFRLLGSPVHTTSRADATERVVRWADGRESRMVCLANVHMIMEAHDAHDFRAVLEGADLVCPDGMPLVWSLRRMGHHRQERVPGPGLMLDVCAAAETARLPIGLYGARPAVISALKAALAARFPALEIAYAASPPFRPMTVEEDEAAVIEINSSGARILLVGLGCPKQERWMAAHVGQVRAVMLGVGAAFDMHAGVVRQAPRWAQSAGLEWMFRLAMEPRRLWRRYARHNPRFVAKVLAEFAGRRWVMGGDR